MKFFMLIIFMFFTAELYSNQNNKDAYPILKFTSETLTLYDLDKPRTMKPLKVKVSDLGDPKNIRVMGFAGGSNEHLIIKYRDRLMTFSRSKVELDDSFDQRSSSSKSCEPTNRKKTNKRLDTTSICEDQ